MRLLRALPDILGVAICRVFHDKITPPIGDYYTCLECKRKYSVSWAESKEPGAYVR